MLTADQCCCCNLKIGAYIAAALFMIKSLVMIALSGIFVGFSGNTRDKVDYSSYICIWTVFLIFSIKVIVDIKKENTNTILAFLLILLYYLVVTFQIMIYGILHFLSEYNDILSNFLFKPLTAIVHCYCTLIIYSFYHQLKTAQEKLNTKEVTLQNGKNQITV